MNQKNTHAWIVPEVVGWFLVSIVGLTIINFLIPTDLLMNVLYLIGSLTGLILGLALEWKYPFLRSGAKGFAIGFALNMAVAFLVMGLIIGFVYPQLYKQNNPYFEILDTSDTFDSTSGNYVFHVKIRNDGIDGRVTVYCEVQKADLTTKVKSQTIYLHQNQETILHFYFSMFGDLGGQLVEKYRFTFNS